MQGAYKCSALPLHYLTNAQYKHTKQQENITEIYTHKQKNTKIIAQVIVSKLTKLDETNARLYPSNYGENQLRDENGKSTVGCGSG